MVQSINNAGSQQALESNWNDENAMRKFERATDGATRQRKHEILDNKQRPNSVELGAGSKSLDQKSLAALPQAMPSPISALASRQYSATAPELSGDRKSPPTNRSRYVIAAVIAILIVTLASLIYFA